MTTGGELQGQINTLSRQFSELSAKQTENHKQNRADIHRLFDGQQTIVDTMRVGLDKIADKVSERCSAIEENIVELRLKWAKAVGYATGISAFGAVVFECVKMLMEHTITK